MIIGSERECLRVYLHDIAVLALDTCVNVMLPFPAGL